VPVLRLLAPPPLEDRALEAEDEEEEGTNEVAALATRIGEVGASTRTATEISSAHKTAPKTRRPRTQLHKRLLL
jgi:hypothetical protein